LYFKKKSRKTIKPLFIFLGLNNNSVHEFRIVNYTVLNKSTIVIPLKYLFMVYAKDVLNNANNSNKMMTENHFKNKNKISSFCGFNLASYSII